MTHTYDNPDHAERERVIHEVGIRIANIRQRLALKSEVIESIARQMHYDVTPRDIRGTAGVLRQTAKDIDKLADGLQAAEDEAGHL